MLTIRNTSGLKILQEKKRSKRQIPICRDDDKERGLTKSICQPSKIESQKAKKRGIQKSPKISKKKIRENQMIFTDFWSRRRGSNPRPQRPERCALPAALRLDCLLGCPINAPIITDTIAKVKSFLRYLLRFFRSARKSFCALFHKHICSQKFHKKIQSDLYHRGKILDKTCISVYNSISWRIGPLCRRLKTFFKYPVHNAIQEG